MRGRIHLVREASTLETKVARMLRLVVVVSFVAGFAIAAAAVASAGGGTALRVRSVHGTGAKQDPFIGAWASPGSTVSMRGRIWADPGETPLESEWTAYLRTTDGEGVPMPVARVTFEPQSGGDDWIASVTLVVPDVPSENYWVDLCSEPTCAEMVGDLDGGYFAILNSRLDHTLLRQVTRLDARVRELLPSVERLERVDEDLVSAKEHLDAQTADMAAARAEADRWRTWVVVLGVSSIAWLLGMALGWRRRRRSVRMPDTVDMLLDVGDADRNVASPVDSPQLAAVKPSDSRRPAPEVADVVDGDVRNSWKQAAR
jgi:hypothetical protein